MKPLVALTLGACVIAGPMALAQAKLPSAAAMQASNQAEHNQLGLLEFCHLSGFIGADAVTKQRGIIAAVAPSSHGAPSSAVEIAGRNGLIAFDESRISLAANAAAQGISVAYSCFQLALRVTSTP